MNKQIKVKAKKYTMFGINGPQQNINYKLRFCEATNTSEF